MDEQKPSGFWAIGTPRCGLICALIGTVIALLMLFVGFWRTLLVMLFAAAGYYVGGVEHKSEAFRRVVNRLFPPKGE